MTDDKALEERMRKTYLSESPQKVENLRALLADWASKPDDVEVFQAFERAIHNLVGSGASFGISRITEAATAFEQFLDWFKAKRLTLNPQRLAVMQEAIQEIDSIFTGERTSLPVALSSCRILTLFKKSTE